jgi:hypothetical protein
LGCAESTRQPAQTPATLTPIASVPTVTNRPVQPVFSVVGYNGAEGKVAVLSDLVRTTATIEGKDPGFFIAFPTPLQLGATRTLALRLQGPIVQLENWDHYASVQITGSNDPERHVILSELCQLGQYGNCKGKTPTPLVAVENGLDLKLPLPAEVQDIKRVELVFIGQARVPAGFVLSNISVR